MLSINRLFLLLFVAVTLLPNAFVAPAKAKGNEEQKMVMGKTEDIIVRAQGVENKNGVFVGFRVEVINPSADKNVVLLMQKDSVEPFGVRLFDSEGFDVSPMMELKAAHKGMSDFSPDILAPGAIHVWYVPLPNQVRVDRRKLNNDKNLQAIPQGDYQAAITFTAPHFVKDKQAKFLLYKPKYKVLSVPLPRMPLKIDPAALGQDIEKVYRENNR